MNEYNTFANFVKLNSKNGIITINEKNGNILKLKIVNRGSRFTFHFRNTFQKIFSNKEGKLINPNNKCFIITLLYAVANYENIDIAQLVLKKKNNIMLKDLLISNDQKEIIDTLKIFGSIFPEWKNKYKIFFMYYNPINNSFSEPYDTSQYNELDKDQKFVGNNKILIGHAINHFFNLDIVYNQETEDLKLARQLHQQINYHKHKINQQTIKKNNQLKFKIIKHKTSNKNKFIVL